MTNDGYLPWLNSNPWGGSSGDSSGPDNGYPTPAPYQQAAIPMVQPQAPTYAPILSSAEIMARINPAYTQAQPLDALAPMRAYQAYKRGLGETPGVSGATPGAPWNMNLLQSVYDLAAASGRTSAPRPGSGNTMPIGGK